MPQRVKVPIEFHNDASFTRSINAPLQCRQPLGTHLHFEIISKREKMAFFKLQTPQSASKSMTRIPTDDRWLVFSKFCFRLERLALSLRGRCWFDEWIY